jgi:hypothetical protein
MSSRARKIAIPLLALVGIQAWLLIDNAFWGRNSQVTLLAAALLVAVIPPLPRVAWIFLRRLRHPTGGARAITAWAVALIAGISLYRYALACGRDLLPVMHDEFQFLLQARMLAGGKLWMPPHPLIDFFDTFYVLIQPHYAAQSFPGTAFFYVPALWLHVTPWKWSIGIAAATVGLFYRVAADLVDGLAGLLAAAMLGLLSMLHLVSTMVLAQTPLLLLALAAIWAYLHWRRSRKNIWAACIGFFSGWMAVTRPSDAVIFGLPLFIAVLIDLCRNRRAAAPLIFIALAAAPWLALQLVFNHGVTGRWLTSPFTLYNQRDQPRLVYGLHIPPGNPPPLTRVPQKRAYYHDSVRPWLLRHRPELFWQTFKTLRLPVTIGDALPQPMLVALLPIGLLAWRGRRAWVLAVTLPLFFLIYTPYPLFPAHYTLIAAPAAILTAVLAPRAISLAWPRARAAAWTALSIFVTGLFFTGPVDNYQMVSALAFHATVLKSADELTAALAARGRPAVVLFRRDQSVSNDFEPVYNLDAAWPDDALVIRAHDRRGENWIIFQYYAHHGPDRAFYLFDESRPLEGLRFLGMASDLASTSVGHRIVP